MLKAQSRVCLQQSLQHGIEVSARSPLWLQAGLIQPMNRQQEFEAQLHHNDLQTVNELLNNLEKEVLKQFYEFHFDEIVALIAKCRDLRLVLGDLYLLDSTMIPILSEDNLFVYMVNVAIQNGVLTKSSFE